jgi:hypothetical protein
MTYDRSDALCRGGAITLLMVFNAERELVYSCSVP